MIKIFKTKMKNKFWVAIGILSFGLVLPQAAFALGNVAKELTILVFHLFLAPFILILQLELLILPKIAAYNNFINEDGVVQAWIVLRDVANMFFILVLLFIAFATILRVKSYGFKQLLSRFIIVVILVNFSRTIIGLVVDLFQVVMLTFVNAIQNVMAGNIMVALGLTKIVSFSEAGAGSIEGGDFLAAVVFGAIMLVVAVVVIGVFIFILAMRIVKIWFYVVAAPLAFLSYTVPRTAKYFDQWVDGLLNTIIVGPVIAFLLWLSFTIVGNGQIATSFPPVGGQVVTEEDYNVFAASTELPNVLTYVIGIAVLFGSLIAAQKLGTGGKLASMAAGKLQSTASSLGRRYAGGAALRTGALASRGLINEKGEAIGGLAAINKMPLLSFWGGRLQRGAMKTQGMYAARIQKEREGDQKNIMSRHTEAFTASQKSKDFVPEIFGKKAKLFGKEINLGKIASTVTSAGGNFDKDIMHAQNRTDRNSVDYTDEKDVKQTADALRAVGDETRLQKLQGKSIHAFQDDELKRSLRDKGVDSISGVNTKGITAAQMQVIMDQDVKASGAMIDKMDKTKKDIFMAELDRHMSSFGPASDIGVKDSTVQKARIMQARFDGDNDHLHDALDAVTDATRDDFAEILVKVATGKELGKIQDKRTYVPATSQYKLVDAVQGRASQIQAEAILGEATSNDQRQRLVKNQVSLGGNIKGMMANPRTQGMVEESDVKDYYDSQIPTTATAADPRRTRLAKSNYEYAHHAFANLTDFDDFVKTIVKVEDVLKLDSAELKRIVAASAAAPGTILTPAMLEALKKHGVE